MHIWYPKGADRALQPPHEVAGGTVNVKAGVGDGKGHDGQTPQLNRRGNQEAGLRVACGWDKQGNDGQSPQLNIGGGQPIAGLGLAFGLG